ncbi:MAG TPA: chemotaxis protein CheW [Nitrospirae bacterium]|nr:chemotaxis protein CheW [Nitrospirota bacterium]
MNTLQEDSREIKDDILQLATFRLGEEEYAVEISTVQEINRMTEITKVPNSPPYIEGVLNLRGKIIPAVNLRKKFGLSEKDFDRHTRIMVVDIMETMVGLIVDAVSEVMRISAETLEPAPAMTTGVHSKYIKGIGKINDRLIILLDLDKLFTGEEPDNLK